MSQQSNLDLAVEAQPNQDRFVFEPIKGYPMLNWRGKRPFTSTAYYPAQLKEQHGSPVSGIDADGKPINNWLNKIFWGDNLQVMAHLLKEFRGKVDLVYIDPPFDSKADYKKKISVRGNVLKNDSTIFEEKQYTDIWTNDDYLQFIYERLIFIKELLKENGSIFLHCDWHKSHHLRCIMDEVFGASSFRNEIVWTYYGPGSPGMRTFNKKHDNLFWYSKSETEWTFNADEIRVPHDEKTLENFKDGLRGSGFIAGDYEIPKGKIPESHWMYAIAGRYPLDGVKRVGYPTEKPMPLIERIIEACSRRNDIILDCFMGSGTTQAVAMKLGRRFIGADINLGAIQTTTKRLIKVAQELDAKVAAAEVAQQQLDVDSDEADQQKPTTYYTGFEVYNVNHYDVFRNPVQAKELLIEALGIQKIPNSIYDGEKDGRMVKIMPINRIATRADLGDLISGVDYKAYEKLRDQNPNKPVEKMLLVCMGHEPDLAASLKQEIGFKLDIEIVDILRDKTDLQFKRDSEAKLAIQKGQLVIERFYPMNLLQKLSQTKETVDDWREMVESVMIDWNYDGAIFQPSVTDIPGKNDLVMGCYDIPEDAGKIRVKITDLLSESWEGDING